MASFNLTEHVGNSVRWILQKVMDLGNMSAADLARYPKVFLGGILAVAGYITYRQWVAGRYCTSKATLNGKTVIITGANSGIGLETAVDMAQRGARVIMACRSTEKGEKAVTEVRKRTSSTNIIFMYLDLSSLESVREFAKEILDSEEHLEILINNAGISCPFYWTTEDGFEAHMGVNHLGHFLLTNLLLPLLTTSQPARIVNVTSSLYKKSPEFDFAAMRSPTKPSGYSGFVAYSQSKLANILFTRALARRLEGTGVCAYVIHPGVIFRTGIVRHYVSETSFIKKILLRLVAYFFLKTVPQGAQTTIHCAVAEELEGVSGRYYGNCQEEQLVTAVATDDSVAEELWTVSEGMVGL